jgi:hypothetical protein
LYLTLEASPAEAKKVRQAFEKPRGKGRGRRKGPEEGDGR